MAIEIVEWFDWDKIPQAPPAQNESNRIYIGNETCECFLPEPQQAMDYCQSQLDLGRHLTIVTSRISDKLFTRAVKIIELLSTKHTNLEIVCNDWGLLHTANRLFGCNLVAGRLLAIQRTDPRFALFFRNVFQKSLERNVPHIDGFSARLMHCPPSPALISHLRQCSLDCSETLSLLQTKNINRFEISNLLQGIETSLSTGWRVSLYYPDVLIAVARNCSKISQRKCPSRPDSGCSTPIFPVLKEDIPGTPYRNGNAWFYTNPNLPEQLSELGIDRIVCRKGYHHALCNVEINKNVERKS